MMDFVRLAILPDELALSYRGRLARVNGWSTAALAAKKLSSWVSTQTSPDGKLSGVEVLAYVAGMDVTSFVRNHTMLPFQRAVVSSLEGVPHGCADRRSLLEKRAYCATRQHLYFCRACVKDDMDSRGTPYWRRSHQLPGMLWCPTHETSLTSVESTLDHLQIPHDCLAIGVDVSQEKLNAARTNPYVHRFIDICLDMLAGEQPIHESHISKVVRDRIQQLQEHSDGQVTPPLQGGLLKSLFGLHWLNEVLTRGSKTPDQACRSIETRLVSGVSGVNSVGYALLLASLYRTADDALNALRGLSSKSRRRNRLAGEPEVWEFDEKAMRESYFAGGGNQVTIAKNLCLTRQEVKRRLRMLGLPPLGRNDFSKLKSLVTQLLEGQVPLAQICANHGLQLADTSHRLREAMGPLLDAISKLNTEKTPRKESGKQALRLSAGCRDLQTAY